MSSITVNGNMRRVINKLSSGPGAPAHTYELAGGAYVYEVAGAWRLVEGGSNVPASVTP